MNSRAMSGMCVAGGAVLQPHLQVVEMTEVLQIGFSEPKSMNSHSGPSLSLSCEWCNMSELEYLLHNHQHIASARVLGCSSSATLSVDGVCLSLSCSQFDFGVELVDLLSEVASQLVPLCFQCWCEESILNREHFHVQGNVSHLQTQIRSNNTVIVVQRLSTFQDSLSKLSTNQYKNA